MPLLLELLIAFQGGIWDVKKDERTSFDRCFVTRRTFDIVGLNSSV